MTSERFQQIEHLYHSVLERKENQRAAFLEEACAGDEALRLEVESLLAQEMRAERFEESPALEAAKEQARPTRSLEGRQIGPYQVLSRLGAGGMGEVYRAKDTKLDRDVAIKVLLEAFATDPERLARFEREAKVLAALNHPNIAAIYGLEGNALVMELVEGKILTGPLPVEIALNYAKQIAEALEAAHDKGITHRDLKPANIMITREGVVKVLDFGLALPSRERQDAEDSPTRPGMIMGTVAYMSPEQARGEAVDRRADIWAFGALLYEMLTGKRPFTGETASDLLGAVLNNEPDLNAVPPPARKLVARCLTKDRKLRLQAIGDWRLLMEEVGQPVIQPRPSGRGWAAAAALAVIAAVLSLALWRATRPVDRPLMRFSTDLGPEAVEGVNITAAISPDGSRLAFVARGPAGRELLATRLLDQAQAILLAGTENAADPFFSPDGQWIGFFADQKMKKISVQGGPAVTICDAPSARGASWGEDGWIIVTLGPRPGVGLSRVPAAGGMPQAITKPGERGEVRHRWPQILPGGQTVLLTGTTSLGDFENASIEVLSLKTGQWKAVQPGGYFGRYLATSKAAGHLVYLHQGTLFAVGFDLDRLEVRGTPVPLLENVAGNGAGGGQYDIARNGTLVYLSGKSSTASWPIAWMDSSGRTQPLPAAPSLYYTPRFSPEGKRVALAVGPFGSGDIQVYDWQRDTMSRLTFTQANALPVWTPDGKHIVFRPATPGRFSLHWIRADGAGEAQPLLESKGTLIPYSFSPDGQRLAFADSGVDTSFDIWTLPLDMSDPEHPKPGKPELFLRTPFDDREPAFSPDGRWIAYTSAESGRFEVYVRPFPGPGGKWQISSGGGGHPIWARASRELFYETLDDHIMVAAYAASADSFAADKPRLWSSTQILAAPGFSWNLDLAPDGKRFAVLPRPEATGEQKGSVHVTVLLNFFDELRRRVPLR